MKKLLISSSLFASIWLMGCTAPHQNSQVYRSNQVGVSQVVQYGKVESARYIIIDAGTTNLGVGTGTILGSAAVSTIGNGNNTRVIF